MIGVLVGRGETHKGKVVRRHRETACAVEADMGHPGLLAAPEAAGVLLSAALRAP